MTVKEVRTNDIIPIITKALFIPKKSLQCFDKNNLTISRYVNEYELILFEQPGGYFVVNGKKYPILGNDIRLYKPGDFVYSFRFYDVYVIHFRIGDGICKNSELDSLPTYIANADYEKIREFIKNLIQANLNNNIIAQNCHFWNVINELKACRSMADPRNSSDLIVEKVKKYLENNYGRAVTLKNLGNALWLHPNYIHNVFSKKEGMTPAEYLFQIRISHSKELLLNQNMTVEQIALACGFCNSSYFIRKFKEKYQISPKEYRRKVTTVTYGQF